MTDKEKAEALYQMVQELKSLLQQWQRTSKLTKAQKLELRRNTKAKLKESSTSILIR